MEWGGGEFQKGSFNIKSKVFLPFLRVNFESRVTTPPLHTFFSSNAPDQIFYIAILYRIFKRSDKINYGVNTTPQEDFYKLFPGGI